MHASSARSDNVHDSQAIVYGVEDTQKNLTDNVNRMASNLMLEVCKIANATTTVVHCDLVKEVTANQLKHSRQKFVGKFRVLELYHIGKLSYKLDLPQSWLDKRINPVISVAHLEPALHGNNP
ncbi:hypothetical protein N7527_006373 [Penicillium freii]|nr:hypothetical protein N7527_006373 [Penicillium freii]